MSHVYVIVEGPREIRFLSRILPKAIADQVTFINGRGTYGAESLARSVAATQAAVPVVLLIDADTTDRTLIAQKRQDVNYLIRQTSSGAPFQLLLAVPTIETVLFADRALLEHLIDRQLTDLEWHLGQRQPRDLLETVTGDVVAFVDGLLKRLSEEQVGVLRQHPLMQELMGALVIGVPDLQATAS
jgi:hypothetical protein